MTNFCRRISMLVRIGIAAAYFFIAAQTASAENTVQEVKNVLVLNSYYWGHRWTDGQVKGFMDRIRNSDIRTRIFLEHMDIIRQHKDYAYERFATFIRQRYRDTSFDVVVATDDYALRFIAGHYQEFFSGIPIVFSDVSSLDKIEIPPGMPVTGVKEHRDFGSTVDLARALRPEARKIVVFGNKVDNGTGPRSAQEYLASHDLGIPVVFHLDKSYEEILEIAPNIDPRDIVFPLAIAKDRNGTVFIHNDVGRAIANVSPAPPFAFWSVSINDNSAVGGKMSNPVAQGATAAELTKRILNGEDPANIPLVIAPTRYMFMYPRLKQFGIEVDDLPENSLVLEKPISIYEDYKVAIWATAFALMSLLGLVIMLLISIRKRHVAEIALAASHDELEDKVIERTTELVAANKSLNDALQTLELANDQLVESEKMAALGGLVSGVAHEINTPLGVSLTAATHFEDSAGRLQLAYQQNELGHDRLEKFLTNTLKTAEIIVANLSRAADLIRNFKQVAVDQSNELERKIDLESYLETTVNSLLPELKQRRHSVAINCSDKIVIETYPGVIAQVISNLILNSVNHGFGSDRTEGQITIDASRSDEMITIAYRDDGKGMSAATLQRAFDPFFTTARGDGGSGLGLSISYNLVTHKLGGRMSCESTPGEGVLFTVVFPASIAWPKIQLHSDASQKPAIA